MIVGWFGIYWRIAEDEYIPNQLAGPLVRPVITDWLFGTNNRIAFASLSAAIESGEIDPRGRDFGELMAEFATEPWHPPIGPEDEVLRPEQSPLGLSSVPTG
jgi:hypothetical protein